MVILLDLDGVMIPGSNWKIPEFHEDGFPNFTKESVIYLNKIISELQCKLILTTSHRHRYNTDQWKSIFLNREIYISNISIINQVPLLKNRKEEILIWIERNPDTSFIIIDDDKKLNSLNSNIKEVLYLTDPTIGLNKEIYTNIIKDKKSNLFK